MTKNRVSLEWKIARILSTDRLKSDKSTESWYENSILSSGIVSIDCLTTHPGMTDRLTAHILFIQLILDWHCFVGLPLDL